jgi:hypothetical protein
MQCITGIPLHQFLRNLLVRNIKYEHLLLTKSWYLISILRQYNGISYSYPRDVIGPRFAVLRFSYYITNGGVEGL